MKIYIPTPIIWLLVAVLLAMMYFGSYKYVEWWVGRLYA